MRPATHTASVLAEVASWPGIRTPPTPRGATAIVFDDRELGHVHTDRRTLDMPLSEDRREQVLKAGRAREWFSNWVSKPLASDADAQDAIALLRASYDELRAADYEPLRPQEDLRDPAAPPPRQGPLRTQYGQSARISEAGACR